MITDRTVRHILNVVFCAEVKKLESYTVLENKKVEEEVRTMTGLGAGIMERGIKQGLEQGLERGLEQATVRFIENMLAENESVDRICMYTGCSIEQVLQVKNRKEAEESDLPVFHRPGKSR